MGFTRTLSPRNPPNSTTGSENSNSAGLGATFLGSACRPDDLSPLEKMGPIFRQTQKVPFCGLSTCRINHWTMIILRPIFTAKEHKQMGPFLEQSKLSASDTLVITHDILDLRMSILQFPHRIVMTNLKK